MFYHPHVTIASKFLPKAILEWSNGKNVVLYAPDTVYFEFGESIEIVQTIGDIIMPGRIDMGGIFKQPIPGYLIFFLQPEHLDYLIEMRLQQKAK